MNTSRAIVWSFVLPLSFPARARAYPIPPQTLWDLTLKAERIVVARVERIDRDDGGDLAALRVIENWKGPFTDIVRVRFWSDLICEWRVQSSPPRRE
jgi:hypothetical protein